MNALQAAESQLARERAAVVELEARCKKLQVQVATLEQEKAELRREKVALADAANKYAKARERVHAMHKELEESSAALAASKTQLDDARSEVDAVRSNAKAAIAVWVDAESRWLSEQAELKDALTAARSECDALRATTAQLTAKLEQQAFALSREEERSSRLASLHTADVQAQTLLSEQLSALKEAELTWRSTELQLHRSLDEAQDRIAALERDADAQRHACSQLSSAEEQLQARVATLNDRLAAAKAHALQLTAAKEQLAADVVDARTATERVTAQLQAAQRECELTAQNYRKASDDLDVLREKHTILQEQLRVAEAAVRTQDAEVMQLREEVARRAEQRDEQEVLARARVEELTRTRDELAHAHAALATLREAATSQEAAARAASVSALTECDALRAQVAQLESAAALWRVREATQTRELADAQAHSMCADLLAEWCNTRTRLVLEWHYDALLSMARQCAEATRVTQQRTMHAMHARMRAAETYCAKVLAHACAVNDAFVAAACDAASALTSCACDHLARQQRQLRERSVDTSAYAALQTRCSELALFAREAKSAMARHDIVDVVRTASWAMMEAKLHSCIDALQNERAVAYEAVALVLRDASAARAAYARDEVAAAARVQDAVTERAVALRECARLRGALAYELERKLAYKAAVTQVKHLRRECEARRAQEKMLATRAIERANEEVRYWMTCFDELKCTVQPPVAPADASSSPPSLPCDVRTHMSPTSLPSPRHEQQSLQSHHVNTASSRDASASHKRTRTE